MDSCITAQASKLHVLTVSYPRKPPLNTVQNPKCAIGLLLHYEYPDSAHAPHSLRAVLHACCLGLDLRTAYYCFTGTYALLLLTTALRVYSTGLGTAPAPAHAV